VPGVFAIRSGIMKHTRAPSPYSIWLNGRFSQMRKRRSSMVSISFVAASNGCPNESREPQRRTDIAQSFAWTGSPSWNVKPSRKVNVQVSPSADTSCPAHICGRDWPAVMVPLHSRMPV
jgi:hypothetical protein